MKHSKLETEIPDNSEVYWKSYRAKAIKDPANNRSYLLKRAVESIAIGKMLGTISIPNKNWQN